MNRMMEALLCDTMRWLCQFLGLREHELHKTTNERSEKLGHVKESGQIWRGILGETPFERIA